MSGLIFWIIICTGVIASYLYRICKKLEQHDLFEYMERLIIVEWELNDTKTEWKTETLLVTQLNEYGRKGWESVSIKENRILTDRSIFTVIFKRKILTNEKS
jgi:hypothetical protein